MLFAIWEICVTVWLFTMLAIGTYVAIAYIYDVLKEHYNKLKEKWRENHHD
jgi:uncharacterized protein YneF (UPF0154 family)